MIFQLVQLAVSKSMNNAFLTMSYLTNLVISKKISYTWSHSQHNLYLFVPAFHKILVTVSSFHAVSISIP